MGREGEDKRMLSSTVRHRFEILDGLRGIAALCVMTLHFCEPIQPHIQNNWVPHGYLAVDFFFCLSGYVLAYAYDGRWGDMTVGQLLKVRLIRLHPLVIIATLLGLFSFVPILALEHKHLALLGVIRTSIAGMLLVPDSFFTKGGPLFLYAPPAWSLFSEYLASAAYAILLWRLDRRWLIGLLAIAFVALALATHKPGLFDGGWEMKTIHMGLARIAFSFTLGLLIRRFSIRIKSHMGFFSLGSVLLAILLSPHFSFNWYFELGVVMFVFPAMIALGAGGSISAFGEVLCSWLGSISYPLYLTHYFFVQWFIYVMDRYHPGATVAIALIAALEVMAVFFAQFILSWVDEPVRSWVKRKLLEKPGHVGSTGNPKIEPVPNS
jgi:peptidoglycan/LPS O-acetylase OafA/YrhL